MKNVNIYAFADEAGKELSVQIAAMQKNHLQGLEIRGVEGQNVSDLSIQEAKDIRCRLDDAGLITWSVGSPIGKLHFHQDWAAHLDKLKHTLEIANILGAENLRMFSFFIPKEEDPADYRNQVLERLAEMVHLAKGTGVVLCHENEKGIYGDVASRCWEILEAIPEIRGVFDPANFVQCKQDTLEAWALLKERIHYLHIKDATEEGFVVPAGKGAGNVAAIVKDYLARGGRGMTLEPHLTTFAGLKKLEEAGNTDHIGKHFTYPNSQIAFDTACEALKNMLKKIR